MFPQILQAFHFDLEKTLNSGQVFHWVAHRGGFAGTIGDQLAYIPARRFRPVKRIGVDDLGATLQKVTDAAPVILLAHEPDVAIRVPPRVALQLSGHTHGGQVRLLGWSPVVPSPVTSVTRTSAPPASCWNRSDTGSGLEM